MKQGLIVAIILAIVIIRLAVWRRRRAQKDSEPAAGPAAGPRGFRVPPALGETGLVAAREVRERVRGRLFRVVTLLILAGVAAAIVIPKITHSKQQPLQVGVVGTASPALERAIKSSGTSAGTPVNIVPVATLEAARQHLQNGEIDAAVVDGGEIYVNQAITSNDTSTTASFAQSLAQMLGIQQAVRAAGITPDQLARLNGARPVPVKSLQPAPRKKATNGTSIVGTIVVFIMLTQYLTWTLMGVMEEKSNRVVEVLLSAVRPIQLLAGKVLGIGLVAFAQATVVLAFALILARAVGSDLLKGTTPAVLLSALVLLVVGYAFYCWVYAAAGSMAERQDQVQSMALPLSLPLTFGYVIALISASQSSPSTLLEVLAYLPPTAPFAMPVLVGFGAVAWWQFLLSVLISLVCTYGVARVAVIVYRRSVLRTGRRVPLREAFGGERRPRPPVSAQT